MDKQKHHHLEDNHTEHDHHNHEHHDHQDHHDHHDHSGHGGHDHHHHGYFKKIFLISLPIGLVIMWLSPLMGIKLPLQYTFQYSDIIALVLSTILFIYGGKPFFQGAIDEFKAKEPGMMALVSMGLLTSYLYSAYAIVMRYVTGSDHTVYMDFLFEFTSLVLIMLLGHWIEMVALGKAGDAKQALAELLPKDVTIVDKKGSTKVIPLTNLKAGLQIQVPAGEVIAADGIIINGDSRVNESLLTGESKPVSKTAGDDVIGGSINEVGLLTIEVVKTGDDSFLAQVRGLVESAEKQPSRAEDAAKKVAKWLFYIATAAALIAFIVWLIIADFDTAVSRAVTTLVIACPHALGLAIPLVVSRSTSIGAANGLLIKNREVYSLTSNADIMILDKTGTLTTGEFKVLKIDVLDSEFKESEITSIIAGLEQGSTHPIAISIIKFAEEKGIMATKFDQIDIIAGAGLTGKLKDNKYDLISEKAFGEIISDQTMVGATVSVLVRNDKPIATIYLGDEIKESSFDLIKTLKDRGIKPIMATGDNELAAKDVADRLEIAYYANQSPEDKYNLINELKALGEIVIMVGDGINDAPSLVLADVGVAIGAGTQVAIESADVILTNSEPGDIKAFLELSTNTNRKMKENLVWGAGYNFIAIPIAAGILAPVGVILTPAVGAILMSLSTIIVALNAITLRIKKQ